MDVLERIKNLGKDSESYKSIVVLAGEICSLNFKTNKEVVIRGKALKADLTGLINQFRVVLLQAGIEDFCQMGDDEIFKKIIKPLDAFILRKNV